MQHRERGIKQRIGRIIGPPNNAEQSRRSPCRAG
jgi:hypothetical protein